MGAFAQTIVAAGALFATAPPAKAADYVRRSFGTMADGAPVEAIDLSSGRISVTIITLGATIQAVRTPDRDGRVDDIVLGYDELAGYLARPNYFGATLGRVANRIAGGTFTLSGTAYDLPRNNGGNTLHGGPAGFDKRNWQIVSVRRGATAAVTLRLVSPDGDQGFPGTMETSVTYALDAQGALSVSYRATTDRPTIVSLSNHSFWNLAGARSSRGGLGLRLTVPADSLTPLDDRHVPSGAFRPIAGTPFDFRKPAAIGARLGPSRDAELARGYDHNWVIARTPARVPRRVAMLEDPVSGRTLTVDATAPGLQVFSANGFDGSIVGKHGQHYASGAGIALEPQMFPDTPHHPVFGSIRLDPGQVYRSRIIFRFSAAPTSGKHRIQRRERR